MFYFVVGIVVNINTSIHLFDGKLESSVCCIIGFCLSLLGFSGFIYTAAVLQLHTCKYKAFISDGIYAIILLCAAVW